MKKAHLRRSKRCFIFLPFGIAVALKRTPEQTLGFPTKCILVIFSNLRVDAGGKKTAAKAGPTKLYLGQLPSFVQGLFQLQLIVIAFNALSKAILTRSLLIPKESLLDAAVIWHGNAWKATSGKDTRIEVFSESQEPCSSLL